MAKLILHFLIALLLAPAGGVSIKWRPFQNKEEVTKIAPFVEVSHCPSWPHHEKIIRDAAAEAQLVVSTALDRLNQADPYRQDQKQNIFPLPPANIQATLDMYHAVIEPLVQDEDGLIVYSYLWELIELIKNGLLRNMASKKPLIEITCGFRDWLVRWQEAPSFRQKVRSCVNALSDRCEVLYDARDSVKARKGALGRIRPFIREKGGDFYDLWSNTHHPAILQRFLAKPLTEVGIFTPVGLEKWRNNPRALSLENLRTKHLDPETWRIDKVVNSSLTATLLMLFAGSESIGGSNPPFRMPKVAENDGTFFEVKSLAFNEPNLAWKTTYNVVFLVIALYLDNANWATGVNRPILHPSNGDLPKPEPSSTEASSSEASTTKVSRTKASPTKASPIKASKAALSSVA